MGRRYLDSMKTMTTIICRHCGAPKEVLLAQVKYRGRIYCSRACHAADVAPTEPDKDAPAIGTRKGAVVVVGAIGRVVTLRCDCGTVFKRPLSAIGHLKAMSCGCSRSDMQSLSLRSHGQCRKIRGVETAEYRSWRGIIGRCCNPSHSRYPYYGGRGIAVCDRWRESFESFFADMGAKPSPKHSIDRINNDGNYEPTNCRWATPEEQARNTSQAYSVTIGGVTLNVEQWARRIGMKSAAIRKRIAKGMTPESAVRVFLVPAVPVG